MDGFDTKGITCSPVQKITIVPRTMGALGYVMQTPEEEKFLNTKKELEAMIVVSSVDVQQKRLYLTLLRQVHRTISSRQRRSPEQ